MNVDYTCEDISQHTTVSGYTVQCNTSITEMKRTGGNAIKYVAYRATTSNTGQLPNTSVRNSNYYMMRNKM
jgi:hypothetical protein